MNPKLLANENFPLPAVRLLREAGVDIQTVLDVMPAASDEDVLAYARREQRWIVTFDRDYGDLVFRKGMPPPPAIIYLRQEAYSPEKPAELVKAILAMPEKVQGCFVVATQRNVRYRRFAFTQDPHG
jgi:predicted nuclease of predicted toxin-antitoxin system